MLSAVVAVLISRRTDDAAKLQQVLTRHGCVIKTRLGVHEVDGCREDGLVILHACGAASELEDLVSDINAQSGIRAKQIMLDF